MRSRRAPSDAEETAITAERISGPARIASSWIRYVRLYALIRFSAPTASPQTTRMLVETGGSVRPPSHSGGDQQQTRRAGLGETHDREQRGGMDDAAHGHDRGRSAAVDDPALNRTRRSGRDRDHSNDRTGERERARVLPDHEDDPDGARPLA